MSDGIVATLLFLLFCSGTAQAQVPDPSSSDFGGAGLLQTRTARFMSDGTLNIGYLTSFPYERYLITLTPLPGVEATFRYTKINNRDYATNVISSGGSTFTDRGADIKIRLARERRFLPEIAVGVQDGLGTGVFSGEYLALSKRWYDIDFSGGLGWGYNAGSGGLRNPLVSLSKSFRSRAGQSKQGGTLIPSSWFSGEHAGFFAGLEYHTPIKGLSIKLEYEPNDYQNEPLNNRFSASSRINYGFNYRPFPWIDLTIAKERGDKVMMRANLRANLSEKGLPKFDPPPVELRVRPPRLEARPEQSPQLIMFRVPSGIGERRVVPRREENPVGLLFDQLDAKAILITEVSIEENVALLHTESTQPGLIDDSIADEVSRAFAGTVDWVVFLPGGEVFEIVSQRPRRAAEIDETWTVPTGLGPTTPKIELFDRFVAADRMRADAKEQRLLVDGINFTNTRVTIVVRGSPYRQVARTIGRAARIASNHSPDWVEEIQVVLATSAGELADIVLRRADLEATATATGSPEEIWASATIGAVDGSVLETMMFPSMSPDISFSIAPALRSHIGSGDRFYLYQTFLRLSSRLQINRGLSVSGAVGLDLYNNFDRLTVESDSTLPRVRSEIKHYLQQGTNNLINLKADYMWSPAPDLYSRISAGFFEPMFGGYGGEILYRPFGSRLAVGAEIAYVRQRTFEQLFEFREFTTLTGFLNLSYAVPYFDLIAHLSAGQYLAGDRGTTFQVSRRFDGGVRVGGFFTLTDVPFNRFGEGSFDKGFFFSIPFDLLSTRSSTAGGTFSFRPLTKDGGQRMSTGPSLYDLTMSGNLEEISRDWDQFLN